MKGEYNDSNKLVFRYLILGSAVMFLFMLIPVFLFKQINILFLVIIVGFLVFLSLVFKMFKLENKKNIDLLKHNSEVNVKFASKTNYNQETLYSLNYHSPENFSRLKKL